MENSAETKEGQRLPRDREGDEEGMDYQGT